MISDEQAVEFFNTLKEMPFSNKSERGMRGCDLRAHMAAFLLLEYGVEDKDIDKAWIYSLPDETGETPENIRAPIHIIHPIDDELDCNEAGQFRDPDRLSPKPYNIHVAPVIKTSSGKELVFDTYFYDEPPTLDQWREDFEPFEQGTEVGFKRSDISYLHFEHTAFDLDKAGSFSRLSYDSKTCASAEKTLRRMEGNPPPYRLTAQWREQEQEQDLNLTYDMF